MKTKKNKKHWEGALADRAAGYRVKLVNDRLQVNNEHFSGMTKLARDTK